MTIRDKWDPGVKGWIQSSTRLRQDAPLRRRSAFLEPGEARESGFSTREGRSAFRAKACISWDSEGKSPSEEVVSWTTYEKIFCIN